MTLISALLFLAMFMVSSLDFIFKIKERRLKHSINLIEDVFEKIANNGNVTYGENKEMTIVYVKWAESTKMFHYAVQHLKNKKYNELCKDFNEAKEYAKRIIDGDIVPILMEYENIVERKLNDAQIYIPILEQFTNSRPQGYHLKTVKWLIFHDVVNLLNYNIKYNELIVEPQSSSHSLVWKDINTVNGGTVAIGEKNAVEKLKIVIENMENDKSILDNIRYFQSKKLQLFHNTYLEKFNHEREEIVGWVKMGQNILDGKCERCPRF